MIYLVRHGQTQWALEGKHTGKSDIPLTKKGEEQATELKKRLAHLSFAEVWSSPLKRALETCKRAGFDPMVREGLCEWDYGKYEGKTTEEIQAIHPSWNVFYNGAVGGESVTDIAHRADTLLQEAAKVAGDLLLFSHGHFLRALTARYLGLPAREGRLFSLSVASISVLSTEHGRPVILHWNT